MAYLICTLLVLAIVHWFYESTLAPSLRLVAKFDLFAIRDEARRIEREVQDVDSEEAAYFICLLVDEIMADIRRINVLSVRGRVREMHGDPEAQKHFEETVHYIEYEVSPEIRHLYERVNEVILKVSVVNSFMMLFYIAPVALLYSLVRGPLRATQEASAYPNRVREGRPSFQGNGPFELAHF